MEEAGTVVSRDPSQPRMTAEIAIGKKRESECVRTIAVFMVLPRSVQARKCQDFAVSDARVNSDAAERLKRRCASLTVVCSN